MIQLQTRMMVWRLKKKLRELSQARVTCIVGENKMFSFTERDLDAVALLRPITANNNKIDVDAAIANAHQLRSAYFTGAFAALFGAVATRYNAYRANQNAIAALQGMSNRELSDMGVTRSNIQHAVMGDAVVRTPVSKRLVKLVVSGFTTFQKWRSQKNGYQQLMAMDTRQLSDIGLTRGDIAAAVSGKGLLANDNYTAANDETGRKVS